MKIDIFREWELGEETYKNLSAEERKLLGNLFVLFFNRDNSLSRESFFKVVQLFRNTLHVNMYDKTDVSLVGALGPRTLFDGVT